MSTARSDNYEPSRGVIYGVIGAVLLVVGVVALGDAGGDDAYQALSAGLVASGLYCIVAGAVARGIQLARN